MAIKLHTKNYNDLKEAVAVTKKLLYAGKVFTCAPASGAVCSISVYKQDAHLLEDDSKSIGLNQAQHG